MASQVLNERRNCRVLKSKTNLGYGGGNNLAASLATGEILVFLNVDTVVTKDWLDGLRVLFGENPGVGVAQPKLLLLQDRGRLDSAGDIADDFGLGISLGGDWNERDRGQYDQSREVFSARGSALAIRRELFERVKGFDEDFFLDYDDIDLCWRVWLAGSKVMFEPRSVVFHSARSRDQVKTIDAGLSVSRRLHSFKNSYTILIKNYEFTNLIRIIVPSLLVFTPLYFLAIARDSPRMISLVPKGLAWNLLNLRGTMAKRSLVQGGLRVVSDGVVKSHMLHRTIKQRLQFYLIRWRSGYAPAYRWYANPAVNDILASINDPMESSRAVR